MSPVTSLAKSDRKTWDATPLKMMFVDRVRSEMHRAVAVEVGQLHVGAVDRALPRRDREIRLLDLVLVQQRRIEIGDAECGEVRRKPWRIGNLKRAIRGASHQCEARVGIENGRDIGDAALLRRMIVDRRSVRRRIFQSDIAFEEPPREKILGLTDLAAIFDARREGLPRAA